MTWLIKNKDGRYWDGDCWSSKRGAAPYLYKKFVHGVMAQFDHNTHDREQPRIVRLKPRAKLDEAAIRRSERERLATQVSVNSDPSTMTLTLGPTTLVRYENGRSTAPQNAPMSGQADLLRHAILACEWHP